ncbi:MAG: DNA recombination protein RmuC [Candidatus Omnitrophica bacterium]|nr:DNA recombination protein RmuC [Candidatus Omnitrophota bacterium]
MVIVTINLLWIFIVIIGTIFIVRKIKDALSKESDSKLNALRTEWGNTLSKNTEIILNQLNENMKMLQGVNSTMGERLDNAARVVGEVKKSLGSLDEKTQQIYEVGKDIAGLQEILRAPKMRGGLGELFLENLLEQIMPHKDFYELQHCFKSGERVDAVIKVGDKIVPVDSKFPLESFKRFIEAKDDETKRKAKREFTKAVKEHINAIADKYIVPDEGTYDFALMYIPAENVYYEAIIKDEDFAEDKSIFSHAVSKKVIPVSPNSFYAYLQVIVLGIKGLRIEEKTQEVIKVLGTLKGRMVKFIGDFEVVGTHIENIKSSYDRAEKSLGKFEDKLSLIDSMEEKPEKKKISHEKE